MISKHDTLTEAFRQLENYENLIRRLEEAIGDIASPLFEAQHSIAIAVEKEEEFKDMDLGFFTRPLWKLATSAFPTGKFHYHNGKLYQECEYSDGESAASIELLPEFFGFDVEAQREAIRNFYRSFITAERKKKEEINQNKIETAKQLLREAGISID